MNKTLELCVKLQLVAVGTKMPTEFKQDLPEYLRRFEDMPFELIRNPAGKRGKNLRGYQTHSLDKRAADAGRRR